MEEEVIFKIEVPQESITSIENLAKANKQLREERKKLNLETAEGQKRAQEINKQLDANTETIKENSSALEKQRLNVGNYTNSIKDAALALDSDGIKNGLKNMANGIVASTRASLAFIATPIGAVIGALGLAIGALTAYFKGSEEGQNNFNKVVKTGTIVLGNLLDIVRDFGGALFKVFTGDFKGAADDLRAGFEGIKNIVSETSAEIEKGIRIENLRAETDVLERNLTVLKAKNEAEIANLKLQAEDKSLSRAEREDALNRALELQNELSAKAVEVAQNRLTIKREENALSDSTKEDLEEEAQLEANLSLVEKDRADKSKEISIKKQTLVQEQIALLEKERDAIVAAHNAEILRELDAEIRAGQAEIRHQRELEQINERIQAYVSEDELLRRRIEGLDLEADLTDESADANADYAKETKKLSLVRMEEARNSKFTQDAILQSGQVARQVAGESRGLQSALTSISTYFAAQQAYASQFLPVPDPSSPIRGAIAAGIAIAGGLARVAAINNIGFADGGLIEGFARGGLSGTRIMGHHGRSIRRSNGDNMLATVKTGEVILNERQQSMLGGSETFRRIGVPGFATGGITGQIARQSETISGQMQLFDAISRMKPVVTVEDINLGQERVDVIQQRAEIFR